MGKVIIILIVVVLSLGVPQELWAQKPAPRFSDIRSELEAITAGLANNVEKFEIIQKKMEESGKASQNYDEQKNIFLSSMLAITTISSICEYESDLLTLFFDLRESRRRKYYEVRLESLETSKKQIEIMYRQIQINYTIFPPNFFEGSLADEERVAILSTLKLLERGIELLQSVRQK